MEMEIGFRGVAPGLKQLRYGIDLECDDLIRFDSIHDLHLWMDGWMEHTQLAESEMEGFNRFRPFFGRTKERER